MKLHICLLAVLFAVMLLMGCSKTTTVILPPETKGTDPSAPATNAPTAAPTATATIPPTTEPTVSPTAPPATEVTFPPTEAPTVPATETTVPPTQPPTTPPETEATVSPTEAVTEAPATESPKHSVYDISHYSIGSLEYALRDAINQKRADNALPPLTLDYTLCALGKIRAYECTESFSQYRPDGRHGVTVLTDYGYSVGSGLSQRLHQGTSGLSSGTILKGWMYNTDFAADILSADHARIGIGIYEEGGLTYIVCFFTP